MTDKDRTRDHDAPVRHHDSGDNVGRRPADGVGVVQGSGAGAGGGGSSEDFDSDAVGGGGEVQMPVTSNKVDSAPDADKAADPEANRTSGDGRARTPDGG